MITGDYDQLNQMASRNVCSEDGGHLDVAWYSKEKCWVIRCGKGHYPDMITRQLSLTQEYLAGRELPKYIEKNVKKGVEKRQMQQSENSTWTMMVPSLRADLGTGEVLSLAAVKSLIKFARDYDLDPRRGHVVLMYGLPYITIDGYLYHANQEKIPYKLESRPLKDIEKTEYLIPEGAHAWVTTVVKVESGATFTGQGIVTQDEMTEESKHKPGQLAHPVVADHPWQLAQKRAEWQALRRAFPIGKTEEVKEE